MNNKCFNLTCNSRNCNLRHPKKCIKILQNKTCKFGIFCSFEHENTERSASVETDHDVETDLKKRIRKLEEALLNKDHEISILQNKIREIEEVVEVDDLESEKADSDSDTTDSEINDLINEATELDSDSDDLSVENHDCDFCDFTSVHMNGLKVHKARKHRIKCDECNEKGT